MTKTGIIKSRAPSDVIKKVAPRTDVLNLQTEFTRCWLVNALVTWHVSYKVTTLQIFDRQTLTEHRPPLLVQVFIKCTLMQFYKLEIFFCLLILLWIWIAKSTKTRKFFVVLDMYKAALCHVTILCDFVDIINWAQLNV